MSIHDAHVPVGRYDIDPSIFELGWTMFSDNDDRQYAAALKDQSQLTRALWIEVLRNHDRRGERFVKRAHERGEGAHTARRRANDYKIFVRGFWFERVIHMFFKITGFDKIHVNPGNLVKADYKESRFLFSVFATKNRFG